MSGVRRVCSATTSASDVGRACAAWAWPPVRLPQTASDPAASMSRRYASASATRTRLISTAFGCCSFCGDTCAQTAPSLPRPSSVCLCAALDWACPVTTASTSMSASASHPRVRAVRAALQQSRKRTAATASEQWMTDGRSADAAKAAAASAAVAATAASAATPASPSPLPAATSTPDTAGSAAANGGGSVGTRLPWRRILYERQSYPDSHTDESFLSQLVTNANVRPLSYAALCIDACAITQRLAMLALFLLVFYAQLHRLVSARSVLQLDGACLVGGLAAVLAMQRAHGEHTSEPWMEFALSRGLRLLLLTLFLLFLSPLLNTLTLAYSSDTIWALTFLLSALHLLCFDYRWINQGNGAHKDFQGALSLNAGIFAAILLGSRLQDASGDDGSAESGNRSATSVSSLLSSAPVQCFAFILWSFLLFGGMSVAGMLVRRCSVRLHVGLTGALVLLCSGALALLASSACAAPLPWLLLPLFLVVCVGVNLLAPAWLIWSQRYKTEIHGPWDYDDEAEMESDNL